MSAELARMHWDAYDGLNHTFTTKNNKFHSWYGSYYIEYMS